MKHLGLARLALLSCLNFLTKTPASGEQQVLLVLPVPNGAGVSVGPRPRLLHGLLRGQGDQQGQGQPVDHLYQCMITC
jgi:hypothetical protein